MWRTREGRRKGVYMPTDFLFYGKAPRLLAVTVALTLLAYVKSASGQELPPVLPDFLNKAAIACVKINDDGIVVGAFMIKSSGEANIDREMLDWTKQLHWGTLQPGDRSRNIWIPIGLAFGSAKAPLSPATCGPPT